MCFYYKVKYFLYLLTAMNSWVQEQCFYVFPQNVEEYAKRSLFEVWFPLVATGAGEWKKIMRKLLQRVCMYKFLVFIENKKHIGLSLIFCLILENA